MRRRSTTCPPQVALAAQRLSHDCDKGDMVLYSLPFQAHLEADIEQETYSGNMKLTLEWAFEADGKGGAALKTRKVDLLKLDLRPGTNPVPGGDWARENTRLRKVLGELVYACSTGDVGLTQTALEQAVEVLNE